MKKYTLLLALLLAVTQVFAQQADPEYVKVTNERAQKIVDQMDIDDPAKARRVRDLIAQQYRDLNRIDEGLDAEKELAKTQAGNEPAALEARKQALEAKAKQETAQLHKKYIANLSKELTPEQVDQVKDGMTYNVVPKTYAAFLDMIPDLTEAQKKMIMDNLVEAREHAMDAGSSNEKHAWFGKYKGRINNNLSKDGYDLNKESEAWHKRLEAREAAKKENR
ncbi:Protein of unknown function [Catalinimonas alkaloidigena]|uniref:DUF3826 domain-containing protein n=1 Tax=Catalinimonas alkaloidigena TaxID=1075417 RepID=A0A1G9QDT9_9BACT|nr:DUF3826 domain-containing protein [Catalinimonas alkaloidigena]SDM09070.1 Protein of unknown function [Catalinimonas alkaloidigena]